MAFVLSLHQTAYPEFIQLVVGPNSQLALISTPIKIHLNEAVVAIPPTGVIGHCVLSVRLVKQVFVGRKPDEHLLLLLLLPC